MDQPNPGISLTSLAKQKPNMADAMRAALQFSSTSTESTHQREMRASYDAINALLDHELVAKGYSIANLPHPLRLFQGHNNVGQFAAMVEFACAPRQRLVNWRNCTLHKDRLATMDLSDPQEAFKKMEAEACGMPIGVEINTSTVAGSAVSTGSGPQQPKQKTGANLLHPNFAHIRPATPQPPTTLLSPYSTPVQQPTKNSNVPSSCPTQPCMRTGSPYAENATIKRVAKPPTPSSSPFRPDSAQEYMQESQAHMMEGHMPHLSKTTRQSPSNCTTNSSPDMNQDMVVHSRNGYGQVQPIESVNARSIPYGSPVPVMPNHGAMQQQQQQPPPPLTPYVHSASSNGAGNNQLATSQSGQPMQQYNCAPFAIGSNSRPAYQPGTQVQPQQRNAKPVMNPYAEFRAQVNRQQIVEMHMPEIGNRQQPAKLHMPEPVSRQQPASIHKEVAHSVQLGQESLMIPSNHQPVVRNQRHHHSELSYSMPNHGSANHPHFYAAAAPPNPQARPKTKEELEYEQTLATWQKHQVEKEKQKRLEEERKKRLKAELTAALKKGDDIFTYRYREYIEVNPLPEGERMNGYYLSFLANQVVDENDKTEGAMAVRYAKEKYWNQWKIKDKPTVIKLLRDKAQKPNHNAAAEMKTWGHLITEEDIKAIRQTAPLYTAPEAGQPEVEIED